MPGLLRGETVRVLQYVEGEPDRYGEPTGEWVGRAVANVLVCPADTADSDESLGADRPHGTRHSYALHFPKSYKGPLRGCRVEVRGEVLEVEGDPLAYAAALTPGDWDRRAKATAVRG